jgi:hypothetical protein
MQRHRFDALSFGFGIVIAAIGFWLITGHVDVTDLRLTWVWPLPLIVLGVLMLVSARHRDGGGRIEGRVTPATQEGAAASGAGEETEQIGEVSEGGGPGPRNPEREVGADQARA